MPESGRRPQHQTRPCGCRRTSTAFDRTADIAARMLYGSLVPLPGARVIPAGPLLGRLAFVAPRSAHADLAAIEALVAKKVQLIDWVMSVSTSRVTVWPDTVAV